MVQTPTKPISLEDFLQLPETKPASEYIDGQIVPKDMPKTSHGIVQTELAATINSAIEADKVDRAISAGQSQTKVVKKILYAPNHGTQLGWLADTAEDCIFAYKPDLKTALHEKPD